MRWMKSSYTSRMFIFLGASHIELPTTKPSTDKVTETSVG